MQALAVHLKVTRDCSLPTKGDTMQSNKRGMEYAE